MLVQTLCRSLQLARLSWCLLALLAMVCSNFAAATAFGQDDKATTSAKALVTQPVITAVSPKIVNISGTLTVAFDGLEELAADLQSYHLILKGHVFKDANTQHPATNQLSFDLTELRDDKVGWVSLIGSPPILGINEITVGISGPKMHLATKTGKPMQVGLQVFSPMRLFIFIVGAAAIIFVIVRLGGCSEMLRDAGTNVAGRRPYSLALCQMAFWLLLITIIFIGIVLITGDFNNIVTFQSLTLLGISGATAATAVTMDRLNGRSSNKEDQPKKPVHETFFKDLLTDDGGLALHRVQAVIWTVILGAVSCWSAYKNLALPDFDSNLLILMGISSGFYLTLKSQEQQTATDQTNTTGSGDQPQQQTADNQVNKTPPPPEQQ